MPSLSPAQMLSTAAPPAVLRCRRLGGGDAACAPVGMSEQLLPDLGYSMHTWQYRYLTPSTVAYSQLDESTSTFTHVAWSPHARLLGGAKSSVDGPVMRQSSVGGGGGDGGCGGKGLRGGVPTLSTRGDAGLLGGGARGGGD